MEALKENLSELAIGNTAESVQAFLDSQRELFYGQIDQLQNIVVSQCKLTGVNPLSQEMAAGALSIKIGKRPRDLLNPKAVKYMQSVFSIKDAISKKESREISALFGLRVTQVRDFFTSQRTRVRKVVRLSRDKSIKPNACLEPQNCVPTIIDTLTRSDPVPLNSVSLTSLEEAPVPLNSISLTSAAETHVPLNAVALSCVEETPVPLTTYGPTSLEGTPVPLNTLGPASADEGPSCSRQDEALPGIDGPDKNFVQNIFSLMKKEETFSGQVKLMEWILQIQNSAALNWFLSNGGVMILASWLSEADIEEQTSVLLFILKVLCHLPLHKALPVHMSAILQSVNRLRFYRIADISNRARILLSRWSKIFARSQAMKKPNGMQSSTDVQKDILLKQSISEVMADESWQSKIDTPETLFAPSFESSENLRNLENPKTLKMLPAPSDDSSRKHNRDIRGRRKVLMVEQPGQKTAGRSSQVTRAVPPSQGRPMSADDIQKAKLRAQFMQSKYGKINPSNGVHLEKTVGSSKPMTNHAKVPILASKVHLRPQIEEQNMPVPLPGNQLRVSVQPKLSLNPKELLLEKCKRVKIPWQLPPEIIIDNQYGVCTGENSKEVEIQKNRNHREKETIYLKVQEIPPNPKNPWDIEMDYDDSLTPEIPTEQPPDSDQSPSPAPEHENRTTVASEAVSSQANTSNGSSAPAPDLELLAALLKNPELVFALMSGQAGNISSDDTVKLLDMIKSNGGGLLGNENRLDGEKKAEERVEVSLPSPTPPNNPGTSGWIPNNPFSKRMATANSNIAIPITPAIEKFPPVALNRHRQVSSPITTAQQTPHYLPSQQFQASTSPKRSLSITPPVYQNNPNSPILHSPTPSQEKFIPQPPLVHEALHMVPPYHRQVGNLPPAFDPSPWRGRQSLGSNSHSQADQNGYNWTLGGPTLRQGARSLQRGPDPSRERDEYVGYDENEYQNSRYNMTQENIRAWKHTDSQVNIGQDTRSTFQDSSGYHERGRNGERWWTGKDHDRRR